MSPNWSPGCSRCRLCTGSAAQGIVARADKHPAERVDAACAMALAASDPTYRTVRGILAAKHQSSSNHARNSA
jgi:hypothetical protein